GIDWITADNLPENDKIIAKMAAAPMTNVEYTRVIANTPMFSPYVVFGVEPKKLDIIVDTPLPINDRSSPGSFVKSLPTMLLVTNKCPICSGSRTSAAGKIIK